MNILIVQKYVQLRDATKTEDIERVVGEGYRKHGGKHPTCYPTYEAPTRFPGPLVTHRSPSEAN